MGTMLDRKIVGPFVTGPAKSRSLRKPVLVIVITGVKLPNITSTISLLDSFGALGAHICSEACNLQV